MSLTYTAYMARRLIKYGGISIVGFTLIWFVTSAGISAYKAAHPVYVAPEVKYGVLPKVVFSNKTFVKKNFTEQMANDTLPSFADQAKVYVITRSDSTFLALEEDTKTALALGFKQDPTDKGNGVYEFKNTTLNQTLTMNVLENSFQMEYPYQSDQTLLNPTAMPTKEEAINTAKNYLSSAGKLTDDLKNGETKVSYWKISYDGLAAVSSLSEANAIKVDLFRQNLDNLKILSSDVNSASVSVLVTGSQVEGKKIVEVTYKYAQIDRELYSTYPIKTATEAWNDLKMGNYWPASDVSGGDMAIKNMYLAYFEPVSLTNYMQPVYVFEGNNNFVAYVPAVTDKYTK
jgi:hypothetical protein